MKMKTGLLEATALLVGTTIGAGILGIPYVVSKAGFWTGMLVILAIGVATIIINLYIGEVVLRTKGNHQLSGYAGIYIGDIGKKFVSAFMVLGIYGALIAYLLGVGEAASAIFSGNAMIYSLVFFAVVTLIVLRGVKSLGKAELAITSLLILVVILIPLFSANEIHAQNFSGFDVYKLMIPYGVVLFAFMGASAVPTMKEELNSNRKMLRRAIIIGGLIPLVVYLLFTAIVVGIVGSGFEQLTEGHRIATVAISAFVRPEIGILANVFAVLAMTTSFLALSFALSETFQFDFKVRKGKAFLMTLSVPLLIFLADALFFDIASFVSILAIVGSVTGGITGILIVMMHHNAKKQGERKPEFSISSSVLIGLILVSVFVAGIINELIVFFSHS